MTLSKVRLRNDIVGYRGVELSLIGENWLRFVSAFGLIDYVLGVCQRRTQKGKRVAIILFYRFH